MSGSHSEMLDHLFVGGVVHDVAQDIHEARTVGVKDGKIAFFGNPNERPEARHVHELDGRLVLPGLIDLHTHVYWGGCALGIDADKVAAASGVTTYVDAGSAGAGNWAGFYEHVIRRTEPRIFGFLNISVAGLAIYSDWIPRWERTPLNHMSVPAAVEVAQRYPDHIIGFKALCSGQYSSSGATPARLAVEAGRIVGKPVMIHFDFPPPTAAELLDVLRPGDILTHSFRAGPNTLLTARGEVEVAARRARERGVLFDLGHGTGSFSFDVARQMIEQGFLPDIISSDVHTGCIDGPAFDLPTTMSKMLSLGMPFDDVIASATIKPATVIGKDDQLGHLKVGTEADISVFELRTGEFQYNDAVRRSFGVSEGLQRSGISGKYKLRSYMTMVRGRLLSASRSASSVSPEA